MPSIDEHAEEIAGLCAAVAALAIALDRAGSLPTARYRETLERLWLAMPEIDAVGDAGAVIERILNHLPVAGPRNRHVPARWAQRVGPYRSAT